MAQSLHTYSLTDYILSIQVPDSLREIFLGTDETIDAESNVISIGGDESFVGSITISAPSNAQYTTEGDVTGSWVHNKSKDQTGTISIEINQISDQVRLLVRLFQTYYDADTITEGLTLTLNKAVGGGNQSPVATGTDCYIGNRPEVAYGETAATQEWEFTCGRISFSGSAL